MSKINEWYQKAKNFIIEAKIETQKVSWPSREELKTYTVVVLFVVFIVSVYIGVVDKIMGFLLERYLRM